MNWNPLNSEEQLSAIKQQSFNKPQVIFKHSTRCSISSMALSRLERSEQPLEVDFYLLDLIAYRSVSNAVASFFDVHHESPQVILLKNGECIYDESHYSITMDEIVAQIAL